MEKVGVLQEKTVVSVLTEGKKLANELKRRLHPTTVSRETCHVLVESILSSYENAITLLDLIGNGGSSQIAAGELFEPPNPVEGSPRIEGSGQNSKDLIQNCKKRKTLPRWSEQVRVCSGTGSQAQLDDGYNWRKYGQKDILGAVHPRAYYRCTHRNTQGCLATKQVQRADDDPMVFEVVYRGKHSCRQERLKQNKERKEEERLRHSQQMMNELGVVKAELHPKEELLTPSFSFPSTPIDCQSVEPQFFSDTAINFIPTSYSPPFLSPATSESYFSLSPCPVNDFGIGPSLQSSDSDFGEIISNPTQILDFPLGDLDFSMDAVDFECHFLDAPDYI